MELKISNLKKPSNKKFKLIADSLLYSLPLYLTALLALEINPKVKTIATFVVTISIVTLKAISKFTAQKEEVVEPVNVITPLVSKIEPIEKSKNGKK